MFEQFYKKGACEIIKDNADIGFNEELKTILCNLKMYEMIRGFSEITKLFDSHSEEKIYENVDGLTYKDLKEFILSEESIDNEKKRCFISLYELFEQTLGEIVRCILYKKNEIVLNPKSTIQCSELLGDGSKEDIVEKLIEKKFKSIMYTRNVENILSFITRYSKSNIGKEIKNYLMSCSKLRNSLIHDQGVMSKSELSKMKNYIESEKKEDDNKENSNTDPNNISIIPSIEMIIDTMDIYYKVIQIICDDLNKEIDWID